MREKILRIIIGCLLFHVGCDMGPDQALTNSPGEPSVAPTDRTAVCLSAARHRGESGKTAAESCKESAVEAQSHSLLGAVSTAIVANSRVPVSQANFSQVPVWSNNDIQTVFAAARDARFLSFLNVNTNENFKRRIPWLYVDGGCAERAELVASMAGDAGLIRPYKLFAFRKDSLDLVVQTTRACQQNPWKPIVTFGFHTAPIVKNPSGQVYVLDPALDSTAPLLWQDWLKKLLYNEAEQRDGTDSELVNLDVVVADSNAFERDSLVSGGPPMLASALDLSLRYLYYEWWCQEDLGRNPLLVLGDNPPWTLSQYQTWPGKPTSPSPGNNTSSVSVAPTLTWQAGLGATSHKVYLGESLNQMTLVGTSTGTSFSPGMLSPNKSYYWYIVESGFWVDPTVLDPVPVIPTTGDVWKFTTPTELFKDNFEDGNSNGWTVHNTAWSVLTDGTKVFQGKNTGGYARASTGSADWTDQAVEVRIKPVSWSGSNRFAVVAARFVDINNYYYVALRSNQTMELKRLQGNSAITLASKAFTFNTGTWYKVKLEVVGHSLKVYVNGVLQLTALDASFPSGKIALGTYYGVTEFDDVVVAGGTSLPGLPEYPTPTSYATGVELTPFIGWAPGEDSTSQDVYFGSTLDASGNPPFVGNQSSASYDCTYEPNTLNPNTTYYWRINPRNGVGVQQGSLWQFTTIGGSP